MPANIFIPYPSVRRFLWLSLVFCSALIVVKRNWLKTRFPIQMDASGYYIYLPAVFIYHDPGNMRFVDAMPEQFDRKYYLYPAAGGGYLTKYSPGIAILESPFFAVAHGFSLAMGLPATGYEPVYRLAVCMANVFYSILGLWILAMVLSRYFKSETIWITLFLLLFGTNFFFFTSLQPGLSHNFLFAVFALILFHSLRWHDTERPFHFVLACFGVGIATLIRPTEVFSGIVPLVFYLDKWGRSTAKAKLIFSSLKVLAASLMAFLLALVPLFVYWKIATGHWVSYTYQEEGFYFDRPQTIWYGLFGFRKGWFVYTPLMFVVFFGFVKMWKDSRFSMLTKALAVYLPLNIFVVLSWYCWWYGGGFGMRPFIPCMVFLAIPLAFLLESASLNKLKYRMLLSLCGILVVLNIFQSYQYQQQIIHMDAMTWKAYKFVFGKWKLSAEERTQMQGMLEHPGFTERGKKLDEYFK